MANGEQNGTFYKDVEKINAFFSDWGIGEYNEAYKPEFLPQSLKVEYIDFRTKNYYNDTIVLPLDTMRAIFNEAKDRNHLENLSFTQQKMGLRYHVGIADNGHVYFWLIGHEYQRKFFDIQLKPTTLPVRFYLHDSNVVEINKEGRVNPFIDIADSTKQKLLEQDVKNLHYRGNTPISSLSTFLRGHLISI